MTTVTITSFDMPRAPTNFFGKLWEKSCLKFSKKARLKKALLKSIHELGEILNMGWYDAKKANRKIDEAVDLGADKASIANLLMSRGVGTMPSKMMDKILELDPRNKEKNSLAFGIECFKAGQMDVKLCGHGDRATWARNSFIQAAKMFDVARWVPNNFWAEHEEAMEKTAWILLKK